MSKVKLKKSHVKSLYVLVNYKIQEIENRQAIWQADAKMKAERKAKKLKDCQKDINYWQKVLERLSPILYDENGDLK